MMRAVQVRGLDVMNQKSSQRPWGFQTWMANRAVSKSSLALARMILAPGQSGESHRHPNADEVLYLIKGRIAVRAGSETFQLEAADALTIPGALAHQIENVGDEDAEMVLAYSTGERDYVAESPDGRSSPQSY
ncbi:MAG TPA: cupin domain-containing protein [Acidobacteriaceae bacterium]|jgi:mannose-6-phosphate isomerase-like protein (cupin superfamily)|nr:cupin domain-containing protein [Acidobacteriaceae bacterium]